MEFERDERLGFKDTKGRLITIAARLFREKGYKATSLREIADLMGIQKASLYYYIKNKEELLVEVTKRGIPFIMKPIEEIMTLSIPPREKLSRMIRAHLMAIEVTRDNALVALLERRWLPPKELEEYLQQRKRYERYMNKVLEEGIAAGDFPVVDVKLTTFSILGMINWVNQWYDPEGPLPLEKIADTYVELIVERMLGKK